jgi:hypothetical protein
MLLLPLGGGVASGVICSVCMCVHAVASPWGECRCTLILNLLDDERLWAGKYEKDQAKSDRATYSEND